MRALLDALFGRRHIYARVEFDGTYYILTLDEAQELEATAEEGEVYDITYVRLTRRQFEALPNE